MSDKNVDPMGTLDNQGETKTAQASNAVACTNCGGPMLGRSCKLRCPRCGFFEDCSDVGLPAYGD